MVAVYGLTNTLSFSFEHPGLWGIPSDAEFFFSYGYPTLFIHDHGNPGYHTAADTLSSLNFSYFTAMVQAIVGTAAHLADPVDRNPVRQPVLGPVVLLSNSAVRVTVTGQAGRLYAIQASPDFTNWRTITNLTLAGSTGQFLEVFATNSPQRFFRAVMQ